MLAHLTVPLPHVLKGLAIGQVEHQEASHRVSVVRGGDRPGGGGNKF